MVVVVISILARSEFLQLLSFAAIILVGQLGPLLMEVFASQSPLLGVLLQHISIRGKYCDLSPISHSDDVGGQRSQSSYLWYFARAGWSESHSALVAGAQ